MAPIMSQRAREHRRPLRNAADLGSKSSARERSRAAVPPRADGAALCCASSPATRRLTATAATAGASRTSGRDARTKRIERRLGLRITRLENRSNPRVHRALRIRQRAKHRGKRRAVHVRRSDRVIDVVRVASDELRIRSSGHTRRPRDARRLRRRHAQAGQHGTLPSTIQTWPGGLFRASASVMLAYRPQLPTVVASPPAGEAWLNELKHDGYRMGIRARGRKRTDREPARAGLVVLASRTERGSREASGS